MSFCVLFNHSLLYWIFLTEAIVDISQLRSSRELINRVKRMKLSLGIWCPPKRSTFGTYNIVICIWVSHISSYSSVKIVSTLSSSLATVDVICLQSFVHEIYICSGRWEYIWFTSQYFSNSNLFIIIIPNDISGHERVGVSLRFKVNVSHISIIHLIENLF